MAIVRSSLALILPFVLLGGCAKATGDYPSLAIRDAELSSGTIAAPQSPALPAPPRATLDRLGPLASEARAAHAAFNAAAGSASTLVRAASGAATGSESWSVAQVALADLSSRRSAAMVALADLDQLYVAAAAEGQTTAAIAPVRAAVEAMLAEEDAVLERLAGQLAR